MEINPPKKVDNEYVVEIVWADQTAEYSFQEEVDARNFYKANTVQVDQVNRQEKLE